MLESWLWFGGLTLALLTCFVIMVYVRRRIREHGSGNAEAVFDLGELRRMRDTGELTIQEYETLRRRAIAEMGFAKARVGGEESGDTAERGDTD